MSQHANMITTYVNMIMKNKKKWTIQNVKLSCFIKSIFYWN